MRILWSCECNVKAHRFSLVPIEEDIHYKCREMSSGDMETF